MQTSISPQSQFLPGAPINFQTDLNILNLQANTPINVNKRALRTTSSSRGASGYYRTNYYNVGKGVAGTLKKQASTQVISFFRKFILFNRKIN